MTPSVPGGPTPESINNWGEATAPQLTIIWSPCTVKVSPPLSASIPTARLPSNRMRRAVTFPLMVTFNRCLAMFR